MIHDDRSPGGPRNSSRSPRCSSPHCSVSSRFSASSAFGASSSSGAAVAEAVAETEMEASANTEPWMSAQSTKCCWGRILQQLNHRTGLPHPPCEAGFEAKPKHLRDKFCATCRTGFYVPLCHVRAIPADKVAEVRSLTSVPLPCCGRRHRAHMSHTYTMSMSMSMSMTMPMSMPMPMCHMSMSRLLPNTVPQLSEVRHLGKLSCRRDGGLLLPDSQP